MKWIEIIKLRNAGKAPESLKGFLQGLPKNGHPGLVETKLYRHASWETDWGLHLLWESEAPKREGSLLALRLCQTLSEFGLVDHSIWIEESE